MIQLNPKIMQINGFDENCLWMVCKMIDIMKKYKVNKFKNSTLQKYTNWGKNKVIQITDKLEELKIISKNTTTKNYGGQGANSYRILTGFIGWTENMKDQEFEITDEEKDDKVSVSQNQTPLENDNFFVLKPNTAVSQNQTPIKQLLPISLNTSYLPKTETDEKTSLLEYFQKFELSEDLSSLIQMNHKLTPSEIQELFLIFKSESKYLENPPSNSQKTFLNWVQIKVIQKAETNAKLREIQERENRKLEIENELQTKIAQTKLAKYQTASANNPVKNNSNSYQKSYQSSYDVIEVNPRDFKSKKEMYIFEKELESENKIYKTLPISVTTERIWQENLEDTQKVFNTEQKKTELENTQNNSENSSETKFEPKEKVLETRTPMEIMMEAMKKANPNLAKQIENGSQNTFFKIAQKLTN